MFEHIPRKGNKENKSACPAPINWETEKGQELMKKLYFYISLKQRIKEVQQQEKTQQQQEKVQQQQEVQQQVVNKEWLNTPIEFRGFNQQTGLWYSYTF
jgi:hypothetical protein